MFTDHMVLQQGKPLPVWGEGPDGGIVSVELRCEAEADASESRLRHATTAIRDGVWSVRLQPVPAGGPYVLTIRCAAGTGNAAAVTLRDVLVGEVWLAAGQSNMVQQLLFTEGGVREAESAELPQVRLFTTPRRSYPGGSEPDWAFLGVRPADTGWRICSPREALHFSAIGYHFGKLLRQARDMPVGIVSCNWGGTPIEAWMAKEALLRDPETAALWNEYAVYTAELDGQRYEEEYAAYIGKIERQIRERGDIEQRVRTDGLDGYRSWVAANPLDWSPQPLGPKAPERPCGLYRSMLRTVAPYALAGVLWYQGESNAEARTAKLYGKLLAALIANWRDDWGEPELPFLIVQLSAFAAGNSREGDYWACVRSAQDEVARHVPQTALVVTMDCGEERDIHSIRKQPVAERLALAARALVYGEDALWHAPRLRSAQTEGATVRLAFDRAGGGLAGCPGPAAGFAVCGADGVFAAAEAHIDGDTVTVVCPGVPAPKAVRYAWGNFPALSLFGANGMPVGPFQAELDAGFFPYRN
jgi:sialate O-acetylesterase